MAPVRLPKQEPTRRSERVQLAEAVQVSKVEATPQGITKRKRFRRPKQRKNCHLLNLPGELRNEIFSRALISSRKVRITPKGPGEPALLRTCKLIRKEASAFYYEENRFSLQVTDYDGAAFVHFGWQVLPYEPTNSNITFMLGGQPNWENLVRWIEATYYGPPLRPDYGDPIMRDDYIVGAAFKMAAALKGNVHYPSWPTVAKVLDAYHHGLEGTCSIWAGAAGH